MVKLFQTYTYHFNNNISISILNSIFFYHYSNTIAYHLKVVRYNKNILFN